MRLAACAERARASVGGLLIHGEVMHGAGSRWGGVWRCGFGRAVLALLVVMWLVFGPLVSAARAQNDVMMQAFYWDVPVDAAGRNGTWWDTLTAKAPEWRSAGITAIWTPPPSKGNFGIYDMGYGLFDHFDLGAYNQKGTVETRFGSRAELERMIRAMHDNQIEVYCDIVLNHMYTADTENEPNPAVKRYVDAEAVVGGVQHVPYPTNEILWRIPNAQPGDYYIKIKGYALDWNADYRERAYDLTINWTGAPDDTANVYWEYEPNNGQGQFNNFPGSGKHIWAHINYQGDVDEYKITVASPRDIDIRLIAKREVNGTLQWASQENGYRVFEVWYNGTNLAPTVLQACTNTRISYVTHSGPGEQNWTWNYAHFHPVDQNDYLSGSGYQDSIEPNWKLFGQDLNTFDPAVQDRLIAWGQWLTNTVGFDGYRLDFVRGYQEEFVARWVNSMPRRPDGSQRFVVGEYFTSYKYRIKDWVNSVYGYQHNGYRADVDAFDFPLKFTLTQMTNSSSASFNMAWLNHAGMVRDDTGNSLPATSVVTFVENHDTGKEHDKWVARDWKMAYAYILFAEGRPCIFYPHYYAVTQVDAGNPNLRVTAPTSLQTDIRKMIDVRRRYLNGGMIVLTETGNPYPASATWNVYVARRFGDANRPGAILVLNNHETETKGVWVDNAPPGSGYASWAGRKLVNITSGNNEETQVYADGRVYVWAPPRGYAVFVPR